MHEILNQQNEDYKGRLFLGNYIAAQNLDQLALNNIKSVVSVILQFYEYENDKQVENHLMLKAADDLSEDLTKYFQESYEFIDKHLKKTNVLVHCRAGISRSATLVMADRKSTR